MATSPKETEAIATLQEISDIYELSLSARPRKTSHLLKESWVSSFESTP